MMDAYGNQWDDSKNLICKKCNHLFKHKWEKGKTWEGIDEHHSPPEFMLDEWKGKIIPLCRKHHRNLHDRIIKIMFKHSNLFKPKKSEHWTWVAIMPNKRKECIEEVIKFTKEWLRDDTKTITKN